MMNSTQSVFDNAIDQIKHGSPILIFDDAKREGETDMIFPSQFVTPDSIKMLRQFAGGLICTTLREKEAESLHLPFLEDLYKRFLPYGEMATDTRDMGYDKHSSFSFTINHRSTYTGIPDNDRYVTVRKFAEFLGNIDNRQDVVKDFYTEFRIPGHVHLIVSRNGYFSRRRGHTELATYMMESAGVIPSATLAEMLSDSGKAMSHREAQDFAREHNLTFIDGKEIIETWTND
ncbi:MAG: 3,4-dihydroxy-2-butanone-4-phosphate synthase [Cuniculiplasma sp.]